MSESTALAPIGAQAITFRTIDEISTFAKAIAQSAFVPPAFKGKPGDVMAAIMYGLERGLTPMTSLQNIAVINGKPSVYGDLLLGMCLSDPSCESIREADTEEIHTTGVAWCEAKRKGKAAVRRTFSRADAAKAGLAGKGVWAQYESRMLMMRARSWCLRDAFADRLLGLQAREEAQDIIDVTPSPVPTPAEEPSSTASPAPPPADDNALRLAVTREIRGLLVAAHPGDSEEAMAAKRELIQQCFGVPWKLLHRQPLAALQTGLAELQEALYEASAPTEAVEEDVPMGEAPAPVEVEADPSMSSPLHIANLRLLAQQVGGNAPSELQDVLDHHEQGVPLPVYETMLRHLQGRKDAAKAAPQGALV